jgi:hypothetical protein
MIRADGGVLWIASRSLSSPPEPDGHALRLDAPEPGDTSAVALDLLEGEVPIRQAIAIAIDEADTGSFDVEIVQATPGL